MSQPCPLANPLNEPSKEEVSSHAHGTFGQGGQLPSFSQVDASTSSQISRHYWRLFNDLRFSPSKPNIGHLLILIEAFLSLTHQVQMLARMIQVIARSLVGSTSDPTSNTTTNGPIFTYFGTS